MDRFVSIAAGLDVAPALAELAASPEYWMQLNPNEQHYIPLLGANDTRLLTAELPEIWRLIDVARAAAGDRGALSHARVGRMPPGCVLEPHFDGIDGISERRYQLALQSKPGAEIRVGDETRNFLPGDAWRIDVSQVHSVANNSPADRIIILFDTRG